MTRHHFTVRFALTMLAALSLAGPIVTAVTGTSVMAAIAARTDKDKDHGIAPPDQAGPFNVGSTAFSAEMSGGRVTKIRVFYPTLEAADDQTEYTIQTAVGTYQHRFAAPGGRRRQAVPGRFPLVVHDHGGPPEGPDFQTVSQLNVHELMASHGIVTVVASTPENAIARVRDLSLVIDAMLARSPPATIC